MTAKQNPACPCRWKNCKRHGDCEVCEAHHRQHAKHPLPACKKKKAAASTRSSSDKL